MTEHPSSGPGNESPWAPGADPAPDPADEAQPSVVAATGVAEPTPLALDVQPGPQVVATRDGNRSRHPLKGVLIALLAAVIVLALAVAALDVIVWVRTAPSVAPTGPDVAVTADANLNGGLAVASIQVGQELEQVSLSPGTGTGTKQEWVKTLTFGEAIQLTVELESADDFGGEAWCTISGPDGKPLSASKVSNVEGRAICAWVNDGKH